MRTPAHMAARTHLPLAGSNIVTCPQLLPSNSPQVQAFVQAFVAQYSAAFGIVPDDVTGERGGDSRHGHVPALIATFAAADQALCPHTAPARLLSTLTCLCL